jgi:uncharacterized membrane protein YfcA
VVVPAAHAPSHLQGNVTGLGDACSKLKTCFKCTDREECGWCAKAGVEGGSCVLLSNKQAACVANGGQFAECPFFTVELGVTSGLIALCALLSAGGGIGGGALFIPIYLIIYGLTAHQAIPLSKITIFGLAIGGFSVLYSKRHPYRDAPLIDYDLGLLLIPCILLGTIAGVYLNVIFPAFVIVVSLVLLLTYTSFVTWKKSFSLYREESEAQGKKSATDVVEMDDLALTAAERATMNDQLQPILERERATPWKKFAIFAITYVGLVSFVLLKGGAKGTSIIGVTCGSPAFFVILLAAVPFLVSISVLVGRRLIREHHEKVMAGYNFLPNDVIYTPRVVVIYPILGVLAGCAAGFLGIGAGMVVAPIMLEIGVLAEVAQATSSFTILFTASSTSLQFIMLGKLPWKAAIWFWTIGFFMSILGQHLVAYLLKRFRKQYLVAFFLAGMISLSGLFMFALNVHDIAADGINGEFHNPCASSIG